MSGDGSGTDRAGGEPSDRIHVAGDLIRPANLPSGIRLVDVVGRGGSGVVWRARDRRAGRDVAVKVIVLASHGPDRERLRERFEREVRALTRLRDHNVLEVRAAGTDRDCCWVLTPLADGSLAQRIERAPITDPGELCELARALGLGLAAAHRLEVVHGDVTPANVLWWEGRPVLADFGTAVVQSAGGGLPEADAWAAGVSSSGDGWPATPGWAAPERLDGEEPTVESDVYGWAATVWSAATGRRPPIGRAPDPAPLPRGLDSIVADSCHPDPAGRPPLSDSLRRLDAERRRRDRYIPGP